MDSGVQSPVREAAVHTRDAQNALPDHWGVYGVKPLTRLSPFKIDVATGKYLQGLNRDVACEGPARPLTLPGQSCDEYPPAATYEGAYFVGLSRTSQRAINAGQNSLAGSYMSAFFALNRVIDGDPFYIFVI